MRTFAIQRTKLTPAARRLIQKRLAKIGSPARENAAAFVRGVEGVLARYQRRAATATYTPSQRTAEKARTELAAVFRQLRRLRVGAKPHHTAARFLAYQAFANAYGDEAQRLHQSHLAIEWWAQPAYAELPFTYDGFMEHTPWQHPAELKPGESAQEIEGLACDRAAAEFDNTLARLETAVRVAAAFELPRGNAPTHPVEAVFWSCIARGYAKSTGRRPTATPGAAFADVCASIAADIGTDEPSRPVLRRGVEGVKPVSD